MNRHNIPHGADALHGRSSADIEHDLRLIRGEIDGTLSALQAKLSPRQVFSRTRARGASALGRADDAIRRNALLCAAAVGLAGVVSGAILMSSVLRGKRS